MDIRVQKVVERLEELHRIAMDQLDSTGDPYHRGASIALAYALELIQEEFKDQAEFCHGGDSQSIEPQHQEV
jgi:hypothetical protein